MIIKVFQKKHRLKKGRLKKYSDEDIIAKQFNTYFTEIGPTLAKAIQASSLNFANFMENCNSTQA